MVRRVFFSFDYDRDVWRAMQVRKSWVTQDREDRGFFDASLYEEAKKKGDAIKRLIDEGLQYTSVTAVLIGVETARSRWVNYEIDKSIERGNGLLGIYIHILGDRFGNVDAKEPNPLDRFGRKYHTYWWHGDNGRKNCGDWIELAAKEAGR
jgi:hypothetical protein